MDEGQIAYPNPDISTLAGPDVPSNISESVIRNVSELPITVDQNITPTIHQILLEISQHIENLNEQASSTLLDPTLAGILGTGIGAAAALAGTYWSNRTQARREALARKDNLAALGGALAGELAAIRSALDDKIGVLSDLTEKGERELDVNKALAHRLNLPPSIVFSSVADQLGLLGKDRAQDVARIYALKSTVEGALSACQSRMADGCLKPADIADTISNLEMFKSILIQVDLSH